MTQRLLTTSEAADYMGITVNAFRKRHRDVLTPYGTSTRYWDREELRYLLAIEALIIPAPLPLNPDQQRQALYTLSMFSTLRRHVAIGSPIGREVAHLFYTLTHPQTEGTPHD